MKNLIYFSIIIACVAAIIFGLTRGKAPETAQAPADSGQAAATAPAAGATSTAAPAAAIGQNVQHFRPNISPEAQKISGTPEEIAQRSFIVTPDLLAKMYLIDTFKPGMCFGSPSSPPEIAVTNLVASNPALSDFLRRKYVLKTELEVYNKLKQLHAITLTETASSRFNFTFMDGQCQNVTYYEGTAIVSGSIVTATVEDRTGHTY